MAADTFSARLNKRTSASVRPEGSHGDGISSKPKPVHTSSVRILVSCGCLISQSLAEGLDLVQEREVADPTQRWQST